MKTDPAPPVETGHLCHLCDGRPTWPVAEDGRCYWCECHGHYFEADVKATLTRIRAEADARLAVAARGMEAILFARRAYKATP